MTSLVAFSLTAPGRAAVDWAAVKVGLKEPTLDDRYSSGGGGSFTGLPPGVDFDPTNFRQKGDAVVFASGSWPDGTAFELVAYRAARGFCVSFEMPSVPRSSAECYAQGIHPRSRGSSSGYFADMGDPVPPEPLLRGAVGTATAAVEVEYRNPETGEAGTVSADVFPLGEEIKAKTGDFDPFNYYVALLPSQVKSSGWEVTTRGLAADGEALWEVPILRGGAPSRGDPGAGDIEPLRR